VVPAVRVLSFLPLRDWGDGGVGQQADEDDALTDRSTGWTARGAACVRDVCGTVMRRERSYVCVKLCLFSKPHFRVAWRRKKRSLPLPLLQGISFPSLVHHEKKTRARQVSVSKRKHSQISCFFTCPCPFLFSLLHAGAGPPPSLPSPPSLPPSLPFSSVSSPRLLLLRVQRDLSRHVLKAKILVYNCILL